MIWAKNKISSLVLEWESNCILIYLSRELIIITFYLQTRNANEEYINSSEVRQCGKSKVYLFIFRMLCVCVCEKYKTNKSPYLS